MTVFLAIARERRQRMTVFADSRTISFFGGGRSPVRDVLDLSREESLEEFVGP